MKPIKTLLGIIFYEQTIGVAEVHRSGTSFTVGRCATYPLAGGVTVENLTTNVNGFKTFLKEKGFKAGKAVVGISANQTISSLLKLPPINDPQVRYSTIRMNLERKMEVDFSEIVFDYDYRQVAGKDSVLVMMLLKKTLAQIKTLLAEVKIVPLHITPASLGLDLAAHSEPTCHVVEYPSSFELALLQGGHLTALQPVVKESNESLTPETATKITQRVQRLGFSLGLEQPVRYCLWGRDAAAANNDSLRQIFGTVDNRPLKASSGDLLCDLAAELAGRSLLKPAEQFNFLNGRHDETKPALSSQWIWRITAGVVLAAILIGTFAAGWRSDLKHIADIQKELKGIEKQVEAAQEMIDQVSYARRWFRKEPKYLKNLRQLTLAFPENSDIWLTGLEIDPSMEQVLSGRAVNKDAVLDVVETLQSQEEFDNVKLLHIQEMGRGTDMHDFRINLQYRKEAN